MAAICARVRVPLALIFPSDPFSRPFSTAWVSASVDQSAGKSEKSDGVAANELTDSSIAADRVAAMVF